MLLLPGQNSSTMKMEGDFTHFLFNILQAKAHNSYPELKNFPCTLSVTA